MRKFTYILICQLLLVAVTASGQQFQATTSKSTVAVGERFRVEYKLDASGDRFTPPPFTGFRILSGPNQSTSMQFVNGRSAYSISFNYVLMAMEEGEITIPPASIKAGPEVIESNELNIKIIAGGSPTQSQGNQGNQNSQGGGQKSQSSSSGNELDNNLFIRANISNGSPYQGEQITVTYKLYFNYNIVDNSFTTLPSLTGFYSEDLDVQNIKASTEVINGQRFNVATLKKAILIPQRSGDLEIDPIEMDLVIQQQVQSRGRNLFDQFFGSYKNVQVSVKSKPLKVKVKPLPSNRPAGFNGAVGDLKMELTADRTDVKSNESINISYKLSGSGNLKLLNEPGITFPTDFEVYDPKVEDNISVSGGGMSGSRTYKYLTIPRHKGEFTIDPVSFTYFDPNKEKYITQTSQTINFNIEKGTDEPTNTVNYSNSNKEEIKLLGSDIRFIKTETELLTIGYSFFGTLYYYLLWLLPVPLFFVLLLIKRKVDDVRGDAVYMKKSRASKMAVKRLSSAKKLMQQGEEKGFYEEVFKALYGFLSDKFNIVTSDLSKEKIRETLESRSVDTNLMNKTEEILNQCEMARFAPMSDVSMTDFYNESIELLSDLQKALK